MNCPNKNTEEWKLMVDTIGETEAYRMYMAMGEDLLPLPSIKALLDKSSKVNKMTENTEQKAKQSDINSRINELISEGEITYVDDKTGEPCAAKGLSNTNSGTNWKIVKDFKGYPKHSQGGVDIVIEDGGFRIVRNGKSFQAKKGLFISALEEVTKPREDVNKKKRFTILD